MDTRTLYQRDFHAWTQEQAAALRRAGAARSNAEVDWENLAEEIESMGRSEIRALTSHIARVIEHLLKLEYSLAAAPRAGWRESVLHHRFEAEKILADSPGLRQHLEAAFATCFRQGRKLAAQSLEDHDGLAPSTLPAECPYTLDQILGEDWWPANRHGLG